MTAEVTLHQPLVGFRAFRVKGNRLVSPIIASPYWDRVMHAECRPHYNRRESLIGRLRELLASPALHRPPEESCGCGIYAHYTLNAVERYWPLAAALVCWGKVLAHPTGFRAEHVRVLALALSPRGGDTVSRATLAATADSLAVPVLEPSQLEPYASEFGMVLDPSLRGYPTG